MGRRRRHSDSRRSKPAAAERGHFVLENESLVEIANGELNTWAAAAAAKVLQRCAMIVGVSSNLKRRRGPCRSTL